jgi:hypothetical protein
LDFQSTDKSLNNWRYQPRRDHLITS